MKKILISLIHNNDKERITYIKPQIQNLFLELQKKYTVEFEEFSYQPELAPVSLKIALLKDFMYWKIERNWNTYKKTKNVPIFKDLISFLKRIILKYLFDVNLLKKWKLRCAIEMYLTNKHIQSFKKVLEKKIDYLICFEDDTIFNSDSTEKILGTLDTLKKDSEDLVYIDLAGGCNIDTLGYETLKIKMDNKFIYYSKPVTNTTCGYLINKNQIIDLNYTLTRSPLLQYLNIDWFFNCLFTKTYTKNKKYDCRHSHPSFFKHGSAIGERQPLY